MAVEAVLLDTACHRLSWNEDAGLEAFEAWSYRHQKVSQSHNPSADCFCG